jgi:ribosomal protein L37E
MTIYYEALPEPARLYIKQCSHCDLKYFGKSSRTDLTTYNGSGKKWVRHLKKHNAHSIHLWNSEWYYDTSITRFALRFSRMNKIVDSEKWANLKEENGTTGGWEFVVWDDERRKKKSDERIGMNTLVDKFGNTFFGSIGDIDYINVFPSRLKKAYVQDIYGNKFTVDSDDYRFQTGEIFGLNKGKKGLADHLNRKEWTCVHCGFVSTKGNIIRWHNDNCKRKHNERID